MKKRNLDLIIWAATTLVFTASAATAQNVCTKPIDETAVKLIVRNATEKPFTVNYVDENCKESAADEQTEPGREFTADTTNGHAFRVREAGTNTDLKGTGSMSMLLAGEAGQPGKVQAGTYRFELLLNGKVVMSEEAAVK